MTYVISDIHGEYEKFMELLEAIDFQEEDTLYVLGDVLDRGEKPISCLLYMMERANVIPIVGNHELMAISCLKQLVKEIDEESIGDFEDSLESGDDENPSFTEEFLHWMQNGCETTLDELTKLDKETRLAVCDYLEEFSAYEIVEVEDKQFLLVHGGLGEDFSPSRPMDSYDINELVWTRPDFDRAYFKKTVLIVGHTPTMTIQNNPNPGYIYHGNHLLDIDCGAHFPGGRLAAICLETGEEFYSD